MRGHRNLVPAILQEFYKGLSQHNSGGLLCCRFCFSIFCRERNSLNNCVCNLVRSRNFFGLSSELLFIRSVDLLAGDCWIGFDCDRGDFGKWISCRSILKRIFYPINSPSRKKVFSSKPAACLINKSRSRGLLIFRDLI